MPDCGHGWSSKTDCDICTLKRVNPQACDRIEELEIALRADKRSQLGAHYTDAEKIDLIVRPVIIEPLTAEWAAIKDKIAPLMERSRKHRDKAQQTRAFNDAQKLHRDFIERLKSFRVLDPACGSGNFLYVALRALKDLEHRANLDAEALGLPRGFPTVGPECVKGIEINPFAAELARVSVWIGEIQWMQRNGFDVSRSPILKSLDNIECRDALLNADGTEAAWPAADAIVGNPPFLGNRKMLRRLGSAYVDQVRSAYRGKVADAADLVVYWFAKSLDELRTGRASKVGLVATQAIRRGASRKTLKAIVENGRIFDAWSDEEWTVDGADVRVSLICFDSDRTPAAKLDGKDVTLIAPELFASAETELPEALDENEKVAFQGTISGGPFEVTGDLARQWISMPKNVNGTHNRDVLRPWRNADDITDRGSDTWLIDFPARCPEQDAAMFQAPFEYLRMAWRKHNEKLAAEGEPPARASEPKLQKMWWSLQRPRPHLRKAIAKLGRYIATARVGKHRVFVWLPTTVIPDTRIVAIAREDDVSFGILQSKIHEVWSLRYGGRHGVGNDPEYIHTETFETFPFPDGMTPHVDPKGFSDEATTIATTAQRLNELRENWLNPPDLMRRVPEVVPGYPDRILPVDDKAAAILKKRTLTNLYNERPTWLANAHRDLDAAVAAAYGWPADLTDDQILERLFKLNQERAARQAEANA